jgi:hypothetical protein
MFFPPPAPSLPRSQCQSESGVVQLSDGNAFEDFAIDYVTEIKGPEKLWVNGYSEEIQVGTKSKVVNGLVREHHLAAKNEQILVNESKFNLAATTETCLAVALTVIKASLKEFCLGGKLEIWPASGQVYACKNISRTGKRKEMHARAKKAIASFEETITKAERQHGSLKKDSLSLERNVVSMIESANDYYGKASSLERQSDSHKRVVSGKESHEPSTFEVDSGGAVELRGKKVELEGGGNKVECKGSKVLVNGTDITVKK